MAEEALAEAAAALSRYVVADATLGETLQHVAEVTKRAVPAAEVVGITLLREGRKPETAIYTDERSPAVDAGQYEEDAGPCLDAFRQQEIVVVADTREVAARWPAFTRTATEQGILSTLSIPLLVGDEGIGAVNLYATVPAAFGDGEVEAAHPLVTQAAVVLANASAYWSAFELSEQLNEAMRSRAVIEQAKGILMAQSRVGPDEAFELLRQASQRENVKLREIAERIVERTRTTTG